MLYPTLISGLARDFAFQQPGRGEDAPDAALFRRFHKDPIRVPQFVEEPDAERVIFQRHQIH